MFNIMINNFRELTAEERQQMKEFANRHRLDYYIPDDGELLWFQLEGLKVYVIAVNGNEGIQYQVEVYKMTRVAMKHFVYLASVLKYIEIEYLPPVHKEGITLKPEQEEKLNQLVKETITDKEENL